MKKVNRKGGKGGAVLEFWSENRNSELLVAVKARQRQRQCSLKRINFIGCRKKLEIMY